MRIALSKISFFGFVFWINALLYGLVYFYPYNDIGEPFIPQYFKLLFDILIVATVIVVGFKKKFDNPRVIFLFFILGISAIGLLHIPHTSPQDYLHFTVRNVIFYSVVFYINVFKDNKLQYFHNLHEKVFRFVLYFGVVLFVLKQLNIPNPYGFHYWFWEKNRLISTWLNPNSLGFYLLFYMVYEYFKNERITMVFLLAAASIFITGSLTAITGVALFGVYFVLELLRKKRIKGIYIISFLIALPVAIYGAIHFGVFDYLLFKIDILFVKKSTVHTSVSTRVKNIYDLYDYMRFDNILSIIFGDFSTETYRRLDSQYLNIFYNYGLIGFFLYVFFQFMVLLKLYKGQSYYSKTLFFFCIWLFFIAFNLTAYLYRGNVNFFFLTMLMFTFAIESNEGSTPRLSKKIDEQ